MTQSAHSNFFARFMLLLMSFALCTGFAAAQNASEAPFVMSLTTSSIEFNPLYTYSSLEAQIYTAIYEGLVTYDPYSLRPVKGMADSWELSEDRKTYTFHINPDAHYWNGDPVLSTHFRDGWLKMLSLGEDAPFGFLLDPVVGATEFRTGQNSDPESVGVRTPDLMTLEIELNNPTSHFLSILAHQSLVAIHPEALETRDWSDFDSVPGSGPYYITEKNSDSIVLSRNPHYWDNGNSLYGEIVLSFNDDAADATARFNSGETQWIYDGFSYSDISVPGSLQLNPQFATSYYFFNAGEPPFDDARIRTALLMLLPLDEIRSSEIHFVPTETLVPQIPGYPEVHGIAQRDRDEAMRLLADAGYENGEGLPSIYIVLQNSGEGRRVAELMKEAWERELSVTVNTEFPSYRAQQQDLREGNYTIGSVSWVADYADPMSFLQLWTSDSPINDAGFHDSSYDDMLQESNVLSGAERYAKLGEAESYLLESGIVLPVSHSPSLNVIDLEVIGGWHPNPLDIHPFKYFYRIKLTPPSNIAMEQASVTGIE